jgi:acyl-coenzyme A synthetase/AMP-(fatty) acid ligase
MAVRFMDAFGDVLYNLHGSTEVAWATIASPRDRAMPPGTSRRVPRHTVVRILDDDDHDVPPGETGRIFVGNEMLFEGYTGGGGEDVVDGLLSTGDLGHLDRDGRLFVEGRSDDSTSSTSSGVDVLAARDDHVARCRVRRRAAAQLDRQRAQARAGGTVAER